VSKRVAFGLSGTNKRRGWGTFVKGFRLAGLGLSTIAMAVCIVPMGCGSSDEHAAVPEKGAQSFLPENMHDALQACADEGARRLQRHSYEIGFEVHLDRDGAVRKVETRGARLDDVGLEQCMKDALMGMSGFVPESASVSVASRAVLGTSSALPQMVELVPVILTGGGGVTILVTITIVVAVAAVALRTPTKEECDEDWAKALEECDKLLSGPNPSRWRTGGYKDRYNCARGLVMEPCLGNEVDWGNQGRPGRRF